MKTQILTIAIAISCLGISSCGNSQTNTTNEPTNTTASTQTDATSSTASTPGSNESTETKETNTYPQETTETTLNNSNNKPDTTNQPKVGTIKQMVGGDLKCYVTLADEQETEHEVGATFEICEQKDQFLNQKVNLSYENVKVNDCQSAEPCGKTKIESLISKMELVTDK